MNKLGYLGIGFVAGVVVTLPFTVEFRHAGTIDPGTRYEVVKVIDGDTIDLRMDGKTKRVRLVGIDTPETVDPRKPVQCFGPEASKRMKGLLSGKAVTLASKPDEDHDSYGRLLRYVFLDGRDIGAGMIEEGYAQSICAAFPHPKCAAYDALEQAAKTSKIGRWRSCGSK
jgi:micrococcal nuclease